MDIERVKREFNKHYKRYDISDHAIIRKYYHSIRVMDLSRLIAKYANFNDNDAEIAAIVGLLHDYARFKQWTEYKTYSDINSIDHGDLAVQMLFDNNEISNYSLNKDNYDEIYDAIKYHNKKNIPDNLSEHNKLLCKVVRDADKLDIFYLLSINKFLFAEDDNEITQQINDAFYKEVSIDRKLVTNSSDDIILSLAMVFDLNFKYSFEYLYNTNLIWKMYDNIKNKEKFKKYFDYVDKYIQGRMI